MRSRGGDPDPARSRDDRPCFLITIDTEGDNSWARQKRIGTGNARYLPRFQGLCEAFGLRPTYLTNYEMAMSPVFQEFGQDVLRRHTGEIGMHLHAWDSPPAHALTADDLEQHPYLIEYPEEVMRRKVAFMTDLLERTFEVKMLSHRAGRWGFDERYARILLDHGYRVDCSVTPHISWRHHGGDLRPAGSDYTAYPEEAYYVDLNDLSRSGDSDLLEVPMTIWLARGFVAQVVKPRFREGTLARRALERFFPARTWLRPKRRSLSRMVGVLKAVLRERRRYAEFMIHSSELMPGGSQAFPTPADVDRLYDGLSRLFAFAARHFRGATLSEFRQLVRR